MEGGVDERLWQARGADETEEPGLPLASGELRLAGGGGLQDRSSSVPVGPGDDVGDGVVVVEAEVLGLGERSLEAVGADHGGEVEEGAGDRGDRDCFVGGGGVSGIDGA